MKKYKKKLIEVAIPLEAINAASAKEKNIRHGHPSTLHLWWARRPLAACRAVLFSQLVDDPSEYVNQLLLPSFACGILLQPKLRAHCYRFRATYWPSPCELAKCQQPKILKREQPQEMWPNQMN